MTLLYTCGAEYCFSNRFLELRAYSARSCGLAISVRSTASRDSAFAGLYVRPHLSFARSDARTPTGGLATMGRPALRYSTALLLIVFVKSYRPGIGLRPASAKRISW